MTNDFIISHKFPAVSVPWPGLDQSSKGSLPSRAAYGEQLWQDEEAVRQLSRLPTWCVAPQAFPLQMTWSVVVGIQGPFHSHFLHPGCMENQRRNSFTSLTPDKSGIYGCMLLQLYVTWNWLTKGCMERHGVDWCYSIFNLVTQIWQYSSHIICPPHTQGKRLFKKVDFFPTVS